MSTLSCHLNWCPGPESNRHGLFIRGILSPLRLPISPPGHIRDGLENLIVILIPPVLCTGLAYRYRHPCLTRHLCILHIVPISPPGHIRGGLENLIVILIPPVLCTGLAYRYRHPCLTRHLYFLHIVPISPPGLNRVVFYLYLFAHNTRAHMSH